MGSMSISPVARGGPDDAAYAEFVSRDRPLLFATAYLLTGDLDRAEQLVQYALATVFEHWSPDRPRVDALRALVRAERRNTHLPGAPTTRFELVDDDGAVTPGTSLIIADLALLPPVQRGVIVLERFVELPVTQIAYVLERPIDEVLALSQQSRAVLLSGHPSRGPDDALRRELIAAVPPNIGVPAMVADDLTRGVRLRRRHRVVRAAVAALALLLVVVGVVGLRPDSVPVVLAPAPAPSASPSAATPSCDTSQPACRGQLLVAWRSEMAEVTQEYLDPTGSYFSAFGYSDDSRSDTGIWSPGGGGALDFRLFRPGGGATEISVQIATSRRSAIKCGTTTRNVCVSQRFMDGNRFILTTTTTVEQGMEVQYSPQGDEVITAIARNPRPGQAFDLTSPQLLSLVQDARLRLPLR